MSVVFGTGREVSLIQCNLGLKDGAGLIRTKVNLAQSPQQSY